MTPRPDLLSPYRPGTSVLHRLPSTAKLAGAAAFVIVVALSPRGAWDVLGAAALLLAAAAALSGIGARPLLLRLLVVEPFALGVALLSLFQPGGLRIFLALLAKSTLCLFCFVLVGMTTRFADLLSALRALRVPRILVTTLALTYRYFFLLADEAARMRRARICRSLGRAGILDRGLTATVIAHLFIRSSERAERVYAAMCSRGFDRDRG